MFKDLTKVQINPETFHVHLAIKISENHVHNLVFELSEFIQFSLDVTKRWGNDEWDLYKLKNHVKLCSRDYQFHYRFSNEDWANIRKQLAAAIEKHELHTAD